MTREPAISISACATTPPGISNRSTSVAPNAAL
jgi:hypothetical protein